MKLALSFASCGLLLALSARGAVATAPAGFDAKVKPLLENHCFDCHDEQEHKAGLRLDNLPADFRDAKTATIWTHVFDKIRKGEMPPKKKAQPPAAVLLAAQQFI